MAEKRVACLLPSLQNMRARDVQGRNSEGSAPFLLPFPQKKHNAKGERCVSQTPVTWGVKAAFKRLGLR